MNHHISDKEYVTAFEQYDDTTIYFGDGAFSQLGGEILLNHVKIAALITGSLNTSLACGSHALFMQMASGFDLETPCLYSVPPEPGLEVVRNMVKQFELTQPEMVIAAGGGSVLDAAKAAYLSWQSGMDVEQLFGVNQASKVFPGREFKRVYCFPTTAGTGSEVTPYANIVDHGNQVKKLIMEEAIVPKMALVDPTLTYSMSRSLTITTALDALTHAMESLLNIHAENANPNAEKWGLEAIRLILYALPRVLSNPSSAADREFLSAAATLAGMCIKHRPTGLPHLCSFSFYGKTPHGLAVSAFLPVFWKFYLGNPEIRSRTEEFKGLFPSAAPQETAEDVVNACAGFISSISGIKALKDLPGFDLEMIEKIASAAKQNPMKLQSAPRPVPAEEAEQTLTEILRNAL